MKSCLIFFISLFLTSVGAMAMTEKYQTHIQCKKKPYQIDVHYSNSNYIEDEDPKLDGIVRVTKEGGSSFHFSKVMVQNDDHNEFLVNAIVFQDGNSKIAFDLTFEKEYSLQEESATKVPHNSSLVFFEPKAIRDATQWDGENVTEDFKLVKIKLEHLRCEEK